MDSDNYVVLKQKEYVYWSLTAEGNQNCDEGTPEFILYSMIPEEGIQKSEVPADLYKFGFQNGMKKKWMNIFDKVLIKRTVNINITFADG